MSIHKDQLRNLIREILHYLTPEIPYSETAVELLMLSAAQETQLGNYLVQIHGPARGVYQIEPVTERDTLDRVNADIKRKLTTLNVTADSPPGSPGDKDSIYNLSYSTALARAKYWLVPEPLPECRPGLLAKYYKKYWNTPKGRATEAEAIAAYCSLCLPALRVA